IRGGSASPISISFDDSIGVTITSPKKLTLDADSEIIMKTPKNVKINGVSQISMCSAEGSSGFTLEGDMNVWGDNVLKEGSDSESFEPFDDEPQEGVKPEITESPKEEKKGFDWKKLAIGALAVVATVAVTSPVGGAVVACAVLGAVVAAGVDVGCQLASNGGHISKVDPYQTVIAACGGALSGAFAATPIKVGGQIAINGAIGGTQAALNGGDTGDIMKGIGIGMIAGKLGKDGYKPTLHFWDRLYVTDGLNAVKKGVMFGAGISFFDTVIGVGTDKIKEKYNEIKQNHMEATNAK
ncbi:hypothetical protein, partial [Clostridium butyricum]|uniref:hypothetical protein n=1 Tax=Clostridium butyricum TaxID=1492 RepID=UPI0015E41BD9